jgi:hypothetical protein
LRQIKTLRTRRGYQRKSFVHTSEARVVPIVLMLLLLMGFFGLFAGLVFFSEGVISPNQNP